MTLFFKRIRQKLLIEKKFGKYTLYALGEIMIVIIGILVAVEVNNRNEIQRDKAVELSILRAIQADLEKDLNTLQIDMDLHEDGITSSRIIQDHLENNRPYKDSLAHHFIASFYVTSWMYNSGGFQTLKSLGVNMITNENIRNEIIYLYDVQYTFLQYLTNNMNNSYSFGEQNILRTRFEQAKLFGDYNKTGEDWVKWDERMVPLDYEALKNDNDYKFHLKTYMNEVYFYLINCGDTKNMISQAIINLEKEIKAFEN